MKKVLIIGTGGTISCVPSADGFVPGLNAAALAEYVPEMKQLANIDCQEICALDSTNVGPQHWQLMAETVAANYEKYDGFILTHGTDTLAYSAAALGQMLQNCRKPVVFTGSQLTMGEADTDAKANLLLSMQVAVSDVQGVCLAFGNQVVHGLYARKMCTENFNGFWSLNHEPLAQVVAGKLVWQSKTGAGYGIGKFKVATALATKVAVVKVYPGCTSDILEYYLNQGYKGAIIESYGAGGIPTEDNNWLPTLEKVIRQGMRIICTSQCAYDGVHLDRYPMGIKANRLGVESGGSFGVEALLPKLMLELAR